MDVIVVASGELRIDDERAFADRLAAADLVIAADGGLNHLASRGAWPDLVVGDLDSAQPSYVELAKSNNVEIVQHDANKDETDLDLALTRAVDAGATNIWVAAMFGGRLDHEVANLGLLAAQRWHPIDMSGGDDLCSVWVVRAQITTSANPGLAKPLGHIVLTERIGTTMTLVPWGEAVTGVTTRGLKWPLNEATLAAGTTRGVSNVCIESQQHIEVSAGTLLVIVDRSEDVSGDR